MGIVVKIIDLGNASTVPDEDGSSLSRNKHEKTLKPRKVGNQEMILLVKNVLQRLLVLLRGKKQSKLIPVGTGFLARQKHTAKLAAMKAEKALAE